MSASVSDDRTHWGPNLAAYVEAQLAARGITANAFADRTPGLSGADITRWRQGTEPRLEKFRALADGLGVSVVDLLIVAGAITADEANRPAPVTPAAPSIDVAIDTDPTLSDLARRSLRDILAAIRDVEGGTAKVKRARKS